MDDFFYEKGLRNKGGLFIWNEDKFTSKLIVKRTLGGECEGLSDVFNDILNS